MSALESEEFLFTIIDGDREQHEYKFANFLALKEFVLNNNDFILTIDEDLYSNALEQLRKDLERIITLEDLTEWIFLDSLLTFSGGSAGDWDIRVLP